MVLSLVRMPRPSYQYQTETFSFAAVIHSLDYQQQHPAAVPHKAKASYGRFAARIDLMDLCGWATNTPLQGYIPLLGADPRGKRETTTTHHHQIAHRICSSAGIPCRSTSIRWGYLTDGTRVLTRGMYRVAFAFTVWRVSGERRKPRRTGHFGVRGRSGQGVCT